jgi:molybdopterin synthase catalytic subunit
MGYLVTDPIDVGPLLELVQSPERGGIACFLGTVRNHHRGREVVRLEYSAYGSMAEAECGRIVTEAESRWHVAVALRHRVGQLEIGDTAVAIAAASAHRDEAFLACRYVIEEVKRRVPIWKREVYVNGEVEWVGSGAAGQQGSGEGEARGSGEDGKQGSREAYRPVEVGARDSDGTRA